MLKTIVWFFKSSQQRSFSRVAPECLFGFLLGAKGSRWSVIDDRPPISAIDQPLQSKAFTVFEGATVAHRGKLRCVCTAVCVTTKQGQGLTHHTHREPQRFVSLWLLWNEFPALDSHCQCTSDILFLSLLLSVTHLTGNSINSFDTFPSSPSKYLPNQDASSSSRESCPFRDCCLTEFVLIFQLLREISP